MTHRHRSRTTISKTIYRFGVFVFLTVLLVLVIVCIGERYKPEEGEESVGSLADRFDSRYQTVQYNGQEWRYRSRDLTNILLIGLDWDEDRVETASNRYAGQSDFLLLITLDRENQIMRMLQIDRDTITPIRIYGAFGDYAGTRSLPISLSYAYGDTAEQNCENTVWATSELLGGIPIDAYIVLDMDSIAIINDALGGVEVTLEDDFSHLDAGMRRGETLILQGIQAEHYVRGRIGVGDGTNASRLRRQRTYMTAAMNAFVELAEHDLDFAGSLYDSLDGHLTTNVTRGWLINRAYECLQYDTISVATIAGKHQVNQDGFMEFRADEDALSDFLMECFFEPVK